MSSEGNQVTCPICSKLVDETKINRHLDSNCATEVAAPSASSTSPMPAANLASVFTRSAKPSPASQTDTKGKRADTTNSSSTSGGNNGNNGSSSSGHQNDTELASLFRPPVKKQAVNSSPNRDAVSGAIKRDANAHEKAPPPTKRPRKDPLAATMPLAAKVRPQSLDDFVGQEELVGKDGLLRRLITADRIPSMILWGGPGCGKTTLARIISKTTRSRFVELSATSHGAADVKKAFEEARGHLALTSQPTIVFIDEIHRFTKVQQDLFLPYVEHGQITLIGATTENPSFKVNGALLSRCRVFVLRQLTTDEITHILENALERWRQIGDNDKQIDHASKEAERDALTFLANFSDGDARSALNTLEIALNALATKQETLTVASIKGAFQKSHLLYDRNGEEHYNVISALHKSIRGSDADAALYWLGRMVEAGEDPLYIARRLVRLASEDIGLADNNALTQAVSTYHACEKIGYPECNVILAHLVVYLAETKKSVRVYKAYKRVQETIAKEPAFPVPLHIRNAPTRLMKDLGYGKDYKYNPDFDGPVDQTYLPEQLLGTRFLDPEP